MHLCFHSLWHALQARTLGDVLVVGVNPDAEIRKFKGPPVMSDKERCALVEAVKWVDEVIPSTCSNGHSSTVYSIQTRAMHHILSGCRSAIRAHEGVHGCIVHGAQD